VFGLPLWGPVGSSSSRTAGRRRRVKIFGRV